MNVDYATLSDDVLSGAFRQQLEEELVIGFRQIRDTGERLPVPSHYASQIAEIVNRGAADPLDDVLKFEVYQEILTAVEHARATVLGEEPKPM